VGGGKGLDFTAPREAELMKKIPENVKIVYTIKTIPAFLTGTIKKAIKDNSSFICISCDQNRLSFRLEPVKCPYEKGINRTGSNHTGTSVSTV